MIKKGTLFLLVFTLILSLCACGPLASSKTPSGILIKNFENAFLSSGDEFSLKNSSDGYSFSYQSDSLVKRVSYSGTADKNKNVNYFKAAFEAIDTSLLTDLTKIASVVANVLYDSDNVSIAELNAAGCIVDFTFFVETIDKNLFDSQYKTTLDLAKNSYLFFTGSSVETNGWVIRSNVNSSSGTVTITATYNG